MSKTKKEVFTRTSMQCKICQSPIRVEIEILLKRKAPNLTQISKDLAKKKPPVIISRFALARHKNQHCFKVLSHEKQRDGSEKITEEQLESLTVFLDLIITKVQTAVKKGDLVPTVTEGVKAAEIKGKLKEDSKWEKELVKFFLGVSQEHGFSN